MVNITLGGLIKTYRINKRLSQFDVVTSIGWKDTSRLSKIEQGRVKPTRPVVEKIISALNLSNEERGEFLLTGGYLPSDEEITKVIEIVKEKIDSWPYPAYLIDFSWRLLACNGATVKAFHFQPTLQENLIKIKPNLLEFPFLPKEMLPVEIFKGEDNKHIKPFSIAQIAQFKIEQIMRTNEKWYRDLIKKMMKNNEFKRLWMEVTPELYQKDLLDYEYKEIKGKWRERGEILRYHLLTSRLIFDVRFQIILYFPIEKATQKFFIKKLRRPKLISHIALFTNANVKIVRKFLVNDLKTNLDKDKNLYNRYVMNQRGDKSKLINNLGKLATKVHIRDWADVQRASYHNGRFDIKKVLIDFRKDLQAKKDINKISQINSISEVSGYTLKQDRPSLLTWENNIEEILTGVFPEEHLQFSQTCVYPMDDLETVDDYEQIKKAHNSIWFLDKNGDLKVGDDATSYLKTTMFPN